MHQARPEEEKPMLTRQQRRANERAMLKEGIKRATKERGRRAKGGSSAIKKPLSDAAKEELKS
jgi:hypothetical protein